MSCDLCAGYAVQHCPVCSEEEELEIIREECEECYGVGMIYFNSDTNLQINKKEYEALIFEFGADAGYYGACPYCDERGYTEREADPIMADDYWRPNESEE